MRGPSQLDPDAWVDQYGDALFHFARLRVKDRSIAEDPERMEAFFNANGSWQALPAHWSLNPAKAQETREFLDHFFWCLSGLPQRTADVFVHREIEGLGTGEICKRLGITENNCWVILYRARMLLRKCLEMVGLNPHAGESKP